MQKINNLQDLFLLRARNAQTNVTVFLMNGYQIRGRIAGFDAFVVVVSSDEKQQIIYKHAISTIIPERAVDLRPDAGTPLPRQYGERGEALAAGGKGNAKEALL